MQKIELLRPCSVQRPFSSNFSNPFDTIIKITTIIIINIIIITNSCNKGGSSNSNISIEYLFILLL